jgi:hypothetical protein
MSLRYVRRKPCTYLASRLAQSPNRLNRASTWASSPRSTIGCVQNNFWAYGTVGANCATILCQNYHYLQTEWNDHPLEPRHLGVPSGAPKTIEPMVRLAQTIHLSCIDKNTISKWTETRFHMTDVIEEFRRVCPKWFLSLWYVWCKPCTYLASTLTLSPNRPKQDSTWATSPRSSIGCAQNDFWAYGTFGANRAPILRQS